MVHLAEFRQDPFSDRWVIIAENRSRRPDEFPAACVRRIVAPCPFCAGHEHETPPAAAVYVSDASSAADAAWQVRVVPNKYPAVDPNAPAISGPAACGEAQGAVGAHEVIIESPRHEVTLAALTDAQVELTFTAYQDRLNHWQRDRRLAYGLVFKNARAEGGASLEHTHSQFLATSLVPGEVAREVACAARFERQSGKCLYCRTLAEELAAGARLVVAGQHFVAFCPYASRFPYETWVVPRSHAARFEEAGPEQRRSLAHLVRCLIRGLEAILPAPPYNYWIHTAPWDGADYGCYHWHLEMAPRLTRMAGFELGTGYFINPLSPEEAASRLRSVCLPEDAF